MPVPLKASDLVLRSPVAVVSTNGTYTAKTNNWVYFYTNGTLGRVEELPTNLVSKAVFGSWTGTNTAGITSLVYTGTNCTVTFVEDGSLVLERSLNLTNWAVVDASQVPGINTFTDINTFQQAFYRLSGLNVQDFGALGDAKNFQFANNIAGATGFDIGRTSSTNDIMEVFGAGSNILWNGQQVVTQQDLVCSVTWAGGDALTLSLPIAKTGTFTATIGTQNAQAFQAAINAASNIVNNVGHATIEVPSGTYLMASPQVLDPGYLMTSISDTHAVLTLSSGGITFHGETNTVLLGVGAGMEHLVRPGTAWISPTYAPYVPMRDTMMVCQGPVGHPDLPLVFENLVFDGGVQQGAQDYNYWEILQANGKGWDTTHHAVADNAGPYNTPGYLQMNGLKVFTNCVFQHWRGEMCICWTSKATNCFTEWDNCLFQDGNATADNMYYGQRLNHCTFNNVGKVLEYYQGNGGPSVMEDCVITNISELAGPGNTHVDCTITGATTNGTMPAFVFQGNRFYDDVGMEFFSLNAAENVSFLSNSFAGAGPGINLTGIGQQPSDGSQVWYMTNILVMGNSFACAGPLSIGFSDVENLFCSNNVGFSVSASIGYATNIILSGNSGYNMGNDYYDVMSGPLVPGDSGKISSGQYMTDCTNNQWVVSTPFSIDGGSPFQTNLVSYGNGRVHLLQMSGATFYLDNTKPSLIPVGAVLEVYANTWDGRNVTNFFTSFLNPGKPMTITNGSPSVRFYWLGTNWVTALRPP